jgi:type 1 glutamine amidotransferase
LKGPIRASFYNKRFVAGSSPSHGWGDFEVDVNKPSHEVMNGVPGKFTIRDESYRHEFIEGADVTVLATNGKGADEHPSVWTVNDPKTHIVVITLGHDEHAHGNEHFQSILTNAVKWVGGGKAAAAGNK